ncbi:MAG: ABC transporter ATP-binding protein [Spirochaetia bacterium]|jgi:ABC-2 type transport system ATP-binding protein
MIQTRALVKRYGTFTAVDGIDLHIRPGEIYGFLGPNGAGKTSTIMMLLGITRPTSGEVFLFGEKYTVSRLDLRRRIGVVPEKHPRGVWPWMTAEEYLRFFAELFAIPRPQARIDGLLKKVDLYSFRNRRIRDFSRGMLQKLSFTRAILHDPDVLLLDEPISGLDPLGIQQVRDLIISENREGRSIFISSHQLSEMERICHRVAIISKGKLMAEDTMENIVARLFREREIHVELEKVPRDLVAGMKKLPSILDCTIDGNTLVVTVPRQGDFRKVISEFLIGQDQVPLRIQERMISLEEAFVTITQETIGSLVSGGGQV